jgi:CubicO group peptidase (beta-lactamase class C family)
MPSRIADALKGTRMRSFRTLAVVIAPVVLAIVVAPPTLAQRTASFKADAPQFADAARKTKLAAAFPAIDTVFRDFVTRAHVPGAAWGIVIDGELAHAGSAGYLNLGTKKAPDADSVFRIASMTKSFTAVAILSLRDQGKLSLDDPAERYVPELKSLIYPTADSPRITIRHLLSHSEGFPEDNPWGDQQLKVSDAQMTKMLLEGIPFANAPGVAYEYSNYGFAILGRIVTKVSGVPYNEYIAAKILRPLGMTATVMESSKVPADRLAHGYRWEDERWKEEPLLPDGAFGPMGGMLTSVRDLSRYVGAMLAAWPPRDGAETAPIARASLREMQQIARFGASSALRDASGRVQLSAGGYGYGLRISQDCLFRHSVAHSGGLPGFGSQMRWLPEHGVGVIAFGNLTYTGWTATVSEALNALEKTGALQPRVVRPSPALISARNAVAQLIARWDDAVAAGIAAENLFLDEASDRRRNQLESLHAQVGACPADKDRFDFVENALRGQWLVSCERGKLLASITLAPTMPPKVQYLSVRPSPPAEPPVWWRPCG